MLFPLYSLRFALVWALFALVSPHAVLAQTIQFPAPQIDASNLERWMKFVEPTSEELSWMNVRWHQSLAPAVAEAKQLNRPVLLWTMNGHPCGET